MEATTTAAASATTAAPSKTSAAKDCGRCRDRDQKSDGGDSKADHRMVLSAISEQDSDRANRGVTRK